MSGKGTLTTSCGSIYSGDFHAGNMEGRGTITFITNDQFVGEFKDSMFNGLGCYTWSSGTSLVGSFENNVCNRLGKKSYPNGNVYVGEIVEDQEHGRGVMTDARGTRIVGLWTRGQLAEELIEAIVPAIEVDSISGPDSEQRIFVTMRNPDDPPTSFSDLREDGQSLVLFANGDKYIGSVKQGQKDGCGMYVYADGTAYKGDWVGDELDSVRHPLPQEQDTGEMQRLHEMNSSNAEAVCRLKQKLGGEKKAPPSVVALQQ